MIRNLTGIRGVAAVWVVSSHYQEYMNGLFHQSETLNFIFKNGHFGVDLFFCLSGFILGYVYYKEFSTFTSTQITSKINNYYLRRFARIYPTYFLTTVIAGFLYLIAIRMGHEFKHETSSNLSISNVILNIVGVQTWFNTPSLNGPAWSVSAEFMAYIVFPWFLIYASKVMLNSVFRACWTLAISITCYETSCFAPHFIEPRISQVLTEFFMGLSVYVICKDFIVASRVVLIARNFVFLGLIIIFRFVNSQLALQLSVPLILLVLIALNFFENRTGKGLSRGIFVRLGIWSYSLYLTHRLIQNVMSGSNFPLYDAGRPFRVIQLFALVALPLLIAWATTEIFENPMRKVILNFSDNHKGELSK
jgi:peptidoglycan/LPS O-acetylase OafA/YrhL